MYTYTFFFSAKRERKKCRPREDKVIIEKSRGGILIFMEQELRFGLDLGKMVE